MSSVSLNTIQDFLSQKRIAFVGMSRESNDISAMLFDEFTRHGIEVLPVNPNAQEIKGRRCYARVQEIAPAPDAVLLFTVPAVTDSVVRDCAEAGIRRVWMYRGGGQGAVSAEAVEFCRQHGIEIIPGECPFMFLNPVRHIHWVHGLIRKISGSFPKAANA